MKIISISKMVLIIIECVVFTVCASQWEVFTGKNDVRDIELSGNTLWAATTGGVVAWNLEDDSYKSYTTADGLLSCKINQIAIDQKGRPWAATKEPAGLFIYEHDSWTQIMVGSTGNEIRDQTISGLEVDRFGNIWVYITGMKQRYIINNNFLWRYDGQVWHKHEGVNGPLALDLQKNLLAVDSVYMYTIENDPWRNRSGIDICFFNGLNFISKGSIDFEDKSYYFALTHIATDSEGDIWFSYFCERGLDTDGVVCNNTAYNTLDGLADDNVRYITPDDSGVVWCTTDGGISKFTGTKWVTYNTTHGIASNLVYKVLIGSDYTLYAATDKGISLLKSNQWKTLKTINEPLHNNYTDMIADKNGLMVFAGENHIARYMDLQWSSMDLKNIRVGFSMYDHFLYSKDLFSRYANYKSFFKSKDGSLYAIGNDNEKGWILKQDAEGKTFSKAYSCDIQKSNGHLLPGVACSGNDSCFWLTSRRNDLILFKNGSTESFPPTDFNINYNKRISSMLLDRDGRSVWVGYASGDIIHVDGNSNTVKKHISDALASDEVTAIARDSSDNLWFASRNEKRSGWVTVLHDNKLTKYLLDSTNKVFGGCNCPYRKIYPPLLSRVLYFCL